MRYPSAWLDELRMRADIVQIVSSYVPLKKSGRRYTGLCPFHNEKTPSFSVDAQKQLYYCFGCKAGGSVIQFVMDIEHLDFQEAVRFLAEQLRMPLPELQNDPGYEKRRSLKERIYLANQAAAKLYHQNLWEPQGGEVLAYLKGRGLTDAVIRRFGIGAATGSLRIGDALEKEGFTQEELLAAGLTHGHEQKAQDMFFQRAVFPIIDAYGNVLGFGGRAMGDAKPKYLNTADTPAFNKRYHVFAANLLRKEKGLKRVVLVEGYMDVVALSQFGVAGAAATLGTALTQEQARLLSRFAPEIHLCYDGDAAGQNATLRGLEVLESQRVRTRALDIPGGLDPDEFIRQNGADAFLALKPISPVSYRIRREKEKYDLGTEDGRTEYAKACAIILKAVREPVELENHLKQLSVDTGYTREVLLKQMGATKETRNTYMPRRTGFRRNAKAEKPADMSSSTVLALLSAGKLPKDVITPEDFEDPDLKLIAEALIRGQTLGALLDENATDSLRQAVGAILSVEIDDEQAMNMAQECFAQAKRVKLEKELEEIERRVQNYSNEDSLKQAQLQRSLEIMQQLKALKLSRKSPL
ncbi:MAG: DNA primase [Clostridiales bacterium]|nr:DNA primase [Clostridiales bacterium]